MASDCLGFGAFLLAPGTAQSLGVNVLYTIDMGKCQRKATVYRLHAEERGYGPDGASFQFSIARIWRQKASDDLCTHYGADGQTFAFEQIAVLIENVPA